MDNVISYGQRSMRTQLAGGVFAHFLNTYWITGRTLGIDDVAVPGGEIGKWAEQTERLGRTLSASARPRGTPLPRGGVAGPAR